MAPKWNFTRAPGCLVGRRNTWCTEVSCGVDWCSSSEIASVAGEIKSSGMLAAGYNHILLDDCCVFRKFSSCLPADCSLAVATHAAACHRSLAE